MTLKDLLKESYHDGMTTEEIAAALSEIDFPTDHSGELDNLRKALAKSNSEAASYKKQLREKMSAEEIREKEDAEKRDKLQSDYDALLKRVRVSENKARFLSLGYDDATSAKAAQALVDGILTGCSKPRRNTWILWKGAFGHRCCKARRDLRAAAAAGCPPMRS